MNMPASWSRTTHDARLAGEGLSMVSMHSPELGHYITTIIISSPNVSSLGPVHTQPENSSISVKRINASDLSLSQPRSRKAFALFCLPAASSPSISRR